MSIYLSYRSLIFLMDVEHWTHLDKKKHHVMRFDTKYNNIWNIEMTEMGKDWWSTMLCFNFWGVFLSFYMLKIFGLSAG